MSKCSPGLIAEHLPFAEVITANARLWGEIAAINAEYRRFPFVADSTEFYPEYEEVRLRAERVMERIRAELAKEGISFDDMDLIKLWSFLHRYYFDPMPE